MRLTYITVLFNLHYQLVSANFLLEKGSLGAVVKLLPCDQEVTGSSPGNSLLQKCRERLRTIDPKWSDPSPDPAQAGATCTGAALFGYSCLSG